MANEGPRTFGGIIARVNDELNKLLAEREIAEKILSIGPMVEPGGTPSQFAAFLRDEHQRWSLVAGRQRDWFAARVIQR